MREVFKVVRIVSEWDLVINGGADNGLKIGDKLEIFVDGQPIIDPETDQELGTLDMLKSIVEVVTVYENMSLCKNSLFEPSSMEILGNAASSWNTKQRKKLNVEISEIANFDFDKEPIKIGDKLRRVL